MVKFLSGLVILAILATGLVACGGATKPAFSPTATPRSMPTVPPPVARPVPPPLFGFTYYQQEEGGKILVHATGASLKPICNPYCTFESEKEVLDWLSTNISLTEAQAGNVQVRSPFPKYEELFTFVLQPGDAKNQSLQISPAARTSFCPVGTERFVGPGTTYYCVGTPDIEMWLRVQLFSNKKLADFGPPASEIAVISPVTVK